MHCIMCGATLDSDSKNPICSGCKNRIGEEFVWEHPVWALRVALQKLQMTVKILEEKVKLLEETWVAEHEQQSS